MCVEVDETERVAPSGAEPGAHGRLLRRTTSIQVRRPAHRPTVVPNVCNPPPCPTCWRVSRMRPCMQAPWEVRERCSTLPGAIVSTGEAAVLALFLTDPLSRMRSGRFAGAGGTSSQGCSAVGLVTWLRQRHASRAQCVWSLEEGEIFRRVFRRRRSAWRGPRRGCRRRPWRRPSNECRRGSPSDSARAIGSTRPFGAPGGSRAG